MEHDVRVVIDSTGAVVNPTINPNPTSDLFIPTTPQPEAMTATAAAEPTLTPLPQVEGFTPQEWLQKCGWTVPQPDALSQWTDVNVGVNIPEPAPLGSQVEGSYFVSFKDIANPETTLQTRIGLCTLGQGWTTDGSHEWNTALHSGTPFEGSISLRFTEAGNIPIFLVVLDAQNNRVAGTGRLIYVKAQEQSSTPPADPSMTDSLDSEGQAVTLAASPQWRTVAGESFNSTSWPAGSPLWRVNDTTVETPTDLDRKWGVHSANYAAWPAAPRRLACRMGAIIPIVIAPMGFI